MSDEQNQTAHHVWISDEEKIICSANTIYHCPKCKHHLNLHPIKLEKVDIENESEH